MGIAVATSFLAAAGLMIGQSAIEALFFARYGVEKLPVMYLILGGTMFLATLGFAALIGLVGRGRACVLIPLALAILAIAGRVALTGNASWITPALWLLQGAAQFLVGLAVWGLAGIITDTRQAKRFFPLIGAGGVLGYVLGGLATLPLATWIGTRNLLLVWAASLIAVVMLGTRLVAIGGRDLRRGARRQPDAGPIEQLTRGMRYVRRSPLMRWLALGSVLFSLLFFSLYLPFSRAATARYPNPDELAGFFGVFFGLSTGVALLLSLFVTNRLLARFGVPTVMLVFPVLYVVTFGVLAIQATFSTLAVFRFAQVAWMQGGATSSTEAVINTVPPDRRDQTRAFLYGGPTQLGTVLAGLIALAGGSLSASTLYVVGFVCAVLATVSMAGVRRAYPRELAHALREGRPHVFGADPTGPEPFGLVRADRSAVAAATQALADPDVRVRRVAVEVLGDLDPEEAIGPLLDRLRDEQADIRAAAIGSLARAGASAAVPAILERLADPEARVRLAAIEAIATLGPDRDADPEAVAPLIHDADPMVRARAASLLVALSDDRTATATLTELTADPDDAVRAVAFDAMRRSGTSRLFDAALSGVTDPAATVRVAAVRAVAALAPDRARDPLVLALGDDHPLVRDTAAEALGVLGADATEPVIESLASPQRREGALIALEQVPLEGRDEDVRRFALSMVGEAVESHRLGTSIRDGSDERLDLLRDSLLSRSDHRALLALRAAAVLGGGAPMAVALENLSVVDRGQRANALEVIEHVGARDIVKPLIAMWDGEEPPMAPDRLFERLEHDPDEWIRACAELASEAADVSDDGSEGGTMTRTLATLSPMERVLFLRKVRLFSALAPPDLEPIAAISQEHAYADGDVIAEQGERGDVLHIIVSGEVSVVVRGDDDQHEVAVRSRGDVVGEMSVITSEPRMAGLVARGDVRVLSIARPQFESILRERPETALGVIRVLSQRLTELSASSAQIETGSTTT